MMNKAFIQFAAVLLLLSVTGAPAVLADESLDTENNTLQSALSLVKLGGGISAGYFYSSNPGEDTDDDAFILTNLLVELSSADEDLPIGFTAAFGETSTHSALGSPENNIDLGIEYASLTMKPVEGMGIEAGLLQPNAGFENTYTFNNSNTVLGAVASQQPYNAYGARAGYDIEEFCFWGGYYKQRLDDEEYDSPEYAWEVGMSASFAGNDFSVYDYHIAGKRNLLGAVVERTIENIDLAFNIDYWTWDNDVDELYGSESSIGAVFYFCPNFGSFSIPARLEYINQDKSQIYIESTAAKQIYAATVSPTYHFNESSYIRAETAYVKADGGFADENGRTRDSRVNLAVELGFIF